MAADTSYRLYALLKATPALNAIYGRDKLDDLTKYTKQLLTQVPYNVPTAAELIESFVAVGAPSKDWTPAFVGAATYRATDPAELVVAYSFDDPGRQQEFIDVVTAGLVPGNSAPILAVGADIGVSGADHWCPGKASLGSFGRRAAAKRTINAAALGGYTGKNVNVVIIDEGLNKTAIKPANWGGGLNWNGNYPETVTVGTAERTSHGMMIARSVLDLAPDAVLYDVPLLPKRIPSVKDFFSGLSSAQVVYDTILAYIAAHRNDSAQTKGPWILVNAWAIFDRATEAPLGDYTENKNSTPGGHPMITLVRKAVKRHKFDVIFAAGNCGQFCSSRRCGKQERGPRHSIWGANALSKVITVGAVLTDEMWAGYSSQGPGPDINGLAKHKPDICAPSNFCENQDPHVLNSGTSTACAVTAGVVAALRSNPAWDQTNRTPEKMKKAMRAGARKTQGPGWNERLGYGILDVRGTINNL